MKFIQKSYDWGAYTFGVEELDAGGSCTIDDFSIDEDSRQNFEASYGFFPLTCLTKREQVELLGIETSPRSKALGLTVRKCEDKDLEGTGLKCKSDTEILDFVDRLTIDIFSIT